MRKQLGLGLMGLITAMTLGLTYGFGLTKTNFSVIGNQEERRLLFLLWGALVGNYCYLYMEKLMRQVKCTDWLVRGFLLASLFLLVMGVGLPYLPQRFPRISRLHVMLSFFAPVCFGISQFRFLCLMQKKTGNIWRTQWYMQLILGIGSFYLLYSYGMVTSLLEIFLTVGLCLYLCILHGKLEKIPDNL